jgi:hypothetical protein
MRNRMNRGRDEIERRRSREKMGRRRNREREEKC